MSNTKQIFVVGSGRSGTTMMGRALNNHKDIFTFKEIHFLGWLCSENDINNFILSYILLLLLKQHIHL